MLRKLAGLVAAAMIVTALPAAAESVEDVPAFFDSATAEWDLSGGGEFFFGAAGDVPLMCDWDGDGEDSIGLYRVSTGFVHFRNRNDSGISEAEFYFGIPGDRPVCGDWDGDGADTVGIFRPSNRRFYLRNSNEQGFAEVRFRFGTMVGTPFAGDWNGNGVDTLGLRHPETGLIEVAGGHRAGEPQFRGYFGTGADELVVGDWDLDGRDSFGVYRESAGAVLIVNEPFGVFADAQFAVSGASGTAVAGNFDHRPVLKVPVPKPAPVPRPEPKAQPDSAPQPEAEAKPKPNPKPRPVPSAAKTKAPLYDTAWKFPAQATVAEADAYFKHLADAGFTGSWISYFNHSGLGGRNVNGDLVATGGGNQKLQLTAGHRDHVKALLDAAHRQGQKVGIVAIWANHYVNDGKLNRNNAYGVGHQLGEAFGDHPAVSMWLAGGDNYRSKEDPDIWRQLVKGLRDAGADQPVGYHTMGGDHLRFANEPWLDFLAPQTGHCHGADKTQQQLARVVNATDKPVFASEMRYEGIRPSWCSTPGGVASAQDVLADVKAAMAAGVDGIVYGHNDRWQWGTNLHGGSGGGGQGALNSLGSAGEKLIIDFLTR